MTARPALPGTSSGVPPWPGPPRRGQAPTTLASSSVPRGGTGVDRDERPLVVVCSTGIDLDAVPAAADARLADGRPGCRVVVAVPPGDDHPVTRALAADLRDPAEVLTVSARWRELSTVP